MSVGQSVESFLDDVRSGALSVVNAARVIGGRVPFWQLRLMSGLDASVFPWAVREAVGRGLRLSLPERGDLIGVRHQGVVYGGASFEP